MIIIDAHNELANFLEKINFNSMGVVRLDQNSFELSSSVVDELTIIHQDVLKSLALKDLARLEELTMVMVFCLDENINFKFTANTIDIITPSISIELFENKVAILSDAIKEKQILKSQLITINNELNETMGNVEVELLKIKKIYEKKAPRRFKDVKGIQVFSKYSAGENIGGEFFDLYVEGNEAFVVMSSTSSYLSSSMILKLFSDFKKDGLVNEQNMLNFIDDVKSNVIELNKTKKKEIEIHLFVGIVDLKKHIISGYRFGDFSILSSKVPQSTRPASSLIHSELSDCLFRKEFQREERILLCSPGFVKNWKKLNPDFMVEELMMNKSIKPIDILDEAFFQLKKDSKSLFLSYDASAIFMEVQKNAMVEV